jgi:cysteine synthase B
MTTTTIARQRPSRCLQDPAEAGHAPLDEERLRGVPIGETPLIRLNAVTAGLSDQVTVYAKAEHLNPGGSVKDRPARRMIREGLRSGALVPGRTLIDATSGNTGIAYAMQGAALGIPVTLAMPSNASRARKEILTAYGAKLILTDPLEGTDGAQLEVKARVARHPERYFYPDQYNNDANWQAHYEGTGAEILAQSGGRVTHFVAALGTTGTFVGVSRRLKAADPATRCIALQPDAPLHGIEGVKHLPTAIVPGIYDDALADDHMTVSTDEALTMARRLANEEGLLVGPSSGANVAAALRLAHTLEAGLVVTILCDTGTRYLGE